MDFIGLILGILLLFFFLTPSSRRGFGGWGLGLLLIFFTALHFARNPFRDGLTWVALLGGVACLGVWAWKRARGSRGPDEGPK